MTPDQRLIDVMPFNQAINFLIASIFNQPMFQLLILLITALSSFFLIRSVIKLSPFEMAKMSSAYLELNPKIGENSTIQKADGVIGFALLLISIVIQAWTVSQPLRWADTSGLGIIQWIFALLIFGVILVIAESCRRALIKNYLSDFKKEVEQNLK